MNCKKCGANLPDDAKFCESCGSKIEPQFVICGKCGKENKNGAAFCENCGNDLKTNITKTEASGASSSQSRTKKSAKKTTETKNFLLIFGIVLIAIAAIMMIFFIKSHYDSLAAAALEVRVAYEGRELLATFAVARTLALVSIPIFADGIILLALGLIKMKKKKLQPASATKPKSNMRLILLQIIVIVGIVIMAIVPHTIATSKIAGTWVFDAEDEQNATTVEFDGKKLNVPVAISISGDGHHNVITFLLKNDNMIQRLEDNLCWEETGGYNDTWYSVFADENGDGKKDKDASVFTVRLIDQDTITFNYNDYVSKNDPRYKRMEEQKWMDIIDENNTEPTPEPTSTPSPATTPTPTATPTPVVAEPTTATKFDSGYRIDLDGDGSEDTIEYDLEKRSSSNKVVLTINDKDFDTAIDNYYPECDYVFYSGDIDVNDHFVEMLIAAHTPQESWMYVYRYNNGVLESAATTYMIPASISDAGTAENKVDAPYIIYSGLEPIMIMGDGSFGLLNYDKEYAMFSLQNDFKFKENGVRSLSDFQDFFAQEKQSNQADDGISKKILPEISTRYYRGGEIMSLIQPLINNGYSISDALRIARNECYANYGNVFSDEMLNDYFYTKHGDIYSKNPSLTSDDIYNSYLNDFEKENIDTIKILEDENS